MLIFLQAESPCCDDVSQSSHYTLDSFSYTRHRVSCVLAVPLVLVLFHCSLLTGFLLITFAPLCCPSLLVCALDYSLHSLTHQLTDCQANRKDSDYNRNQATFDVVFFHSSVSYWILPSPPPTGVRAGVARSNHSDDADD